MSVACTWILICIQLVVQLLNITDYENIRTGSVPHSSFHPSVPPSFPEGLLLSIFQSLSFMQTCFLMSQLQGKEKALASRVKVLEPEGKATNHFLLRKFCHE